MRPTLLPPVTLRRQKEAKAAAAGIDEEKLQKAGALFDRLVNLDPIRAKYWERRALECRPH